jgi:hypothetical protein
MPKGPRGEKRPADVIGNAGEVALTYHDEHVRVKATRIQCDGLELRSRAGKERADQQARG